MKRIKLFSVAAILCAAIFIGYNAYQQATMTEQERLLQANLEALSDIETTMMTCENQSVVILCTVTCSSCNMFWQAHAPGPYFPGSSVCTCGNTLW